MSDLDDLASASGGPSPSSPSARPAAAAAGKSPADRWKPAQRQLEPGELPGPSTAVIVSLAILGVLLLAGGIYVATRTGSKSSGGKVAATPTTVPDARANRPAAVPADTGPATTQAAPATAGTRPATRAATAARKPATKPAAPPPDNFASAKEAVEVSAKVVADDTVRVEMRNKSGRWIKSLLVYGYTKDDPTTPVGEFGSEWLRPGQSIGGDVEWPGISNLLRPGDDVPKLVVQEGEFSAPPGPAKPPAKVPAGRPATPDDEAGIDPPPTPDAK